MLFALYSSLSYPSGVFSSLVSRYNGLLRKDITPSRGAVSQSM